MPTATSNRPPVGHKRHPYGWSARQAAELAGIPARTVQQWAVDGLVAPTYTNPTLGVDQPIYDLGDVVRLKLTRDLLDAGVDRAAVVAANRELATHPQPGTSGITGVSPTNAGGCCCPISTISFPTSNGETRVSSCLSKTIS